MKKTLKYFLGLMASLLLMFVFIRLCVIFGKNNEVLFFNAFFIALISSCFVSVAWFTKNKNLFENFLILSTYIMFNVLFVYFTSVTIDRSLSSFIYFYSVENGSITKDIFDKEYFSKYIQRRFDDGEKIGYLKCDKISCTPTLKSKTTYYLLYPIGKLTKTLTNYDDFSKMVKNR